MQMWTQIVDQIITGLIFFQLIMTALLGVRQSYAAILVRSTASDTPLHALLLAALALVLSRGLPTASDGMPVA